MADKTTGELQVVQVQDLPSVEDVYDTLKIPGELQGGAVHFTGAQFKQYAQLAVSGPVATAKSAAEAANSDAKTAKESASASANASAAAQSALTGVQNAINNIPAGSTPIVNDLTTGGITAALSAEMGKVLGRRPNPNLLINWYFANPVNQRGAASYSSAGYTIDRWKIANARLKVTPEADGLKLERIATGSWTAIRQYFYQLEAGHYTVSVLVSNLSNAEASLSVYKVASAESATFVSSNRIGSDSRTDAGILTCSFDYTPDSALPYVSVTIGVPSATGVGGSFKVVAAKMERGDTQTLAHLEGSNWVLNEIPDYGEELAKCQRYALAIGYSLPSGILTQARTQLRLQIPTPATLRTKPTITEVEITGVRTVNGANITPEVTSSYVDSVTSNGVMFTIETPTFNADPYVNNTPVNCYIQKMFLDAEF